MYFAPRRGFARSSMSFITTPVNNAVDTPAAPHEKPLLFRTTFCSFRLLPAQTRVMGYVTFSYSSSSCRNVIVSGFSTKLCKRQWRESDVIKQSHTPRPRTPSPSTQHPAPQALLHDCARRTTPESLGNPHYRDHSMALRR